MWGRNFVTHENVTTVTRFCFFKEEINARFAWHWTERLPWHEGSARFARGLGATVARRFGAGLGGRLECELGCRLGGGERRVERGGQRCPEPARDSAARGFGRGLSHGHLQRRQLAGLDCIVGGRLDRLVGARQRPCGGPGKAEAGA